METAPSLRLGGVALGFALGGAISAAGLLIGLAFQRGAVVLLIPATAFLLGGAVAGRSLRRGLSACVSFGCAFFVANSGALLMLVGTQAAMGPLWEYALAATVLYGMTGLIGLAGCRLKLRAAIFGVLGFIGGGLLGLLALAAFLLAPRSSTPGNGQALWFIPAAAMAIPWVASGAVLDLALNRSAPDRGDPGDLSRQTGGM